MGIQYLGAFEQILNRLAISYCDLAGFCVHQQVPDDAQRPTARGCILHRDAPV